MVWRVQSLENLSSLPLSLRDYIPLRISEQPRRTGPAVTVQPQRTWSDPATEWRDACAIILHADTTRRGILGEIHIQESAAPPYFLITSVDPGARTVERIQVEYTSLQGSPSRGLSSLGPSLCLVLTAQMELRVKVSTPEDPEADQEVHTIRTAAAQDTEEMSSSSGVGPGSDMMTPALQMWQQDAAAGHRAHMEFSLQRVHEDPTFMEGLGSSSDGSAAEEEDEEDDTAQAAAALAAAATATLELEVVLNAILTEALGHTQYGSRQHRYPTTLDAEAASRALARFLHPQQLANRPERPPQPPRLDMSGPPCACCQAKTVGPSVTLGSDVAVKAMLGAAAQLMPKLVHNTQEMSPENLPNAANVSPRPRPNEEDPLEAVMKNQMCVLCLCSFNEPATLPCGHSFCRGCIHAALSHQPACPVCRAATRHLQRLRAVNTTLVRLLEAAALPHGNSEERAMREKAVLQAIECQMCKASQRDPVTNPCGHSTCRQCFDASQRNFQERGGERPPRSIEDETQSSPISPTSSLHIRESLAAAEARVRYAQRASAVALAAAHTSRSNDLEGASYHDEGIPVVELANEDRTRVSTASHLPPRPSTGWVDQDDSTEETDYTEHTASTCRCSIS